MKNDYGGVDFTEWDWLPQAAKEVGDYLERLLTEAAVSAHDVSARAKSIASFQDKCRRKSYAHPMQDVTDTVAVRIITYSVTDRDRAGTLIRERFQVKPGEDRNPGEERPHESRGYDCLHLIITGERHEAESGWLIEGGELSRYFTSFGGLEIQIRTVASHAWAEFEHARRYKGQLYGAISGRDQETVDQLFAAASDARSALEETFKAIDRVLAQPSQPGPLESQSEGQLDSDSAPEDAATEEAATRTPVNPATLRAHLAHRFPEDKAATDKGMEFACELVGACGLDTIEALARELDTVDGDQVQRLMDTTTPVTRVRRIDDQLLARYGESYIEATGDIGNVSERKQQIAWRYDRLRDKVSATGYNAYAIVGKDCPDEIEGVVMSAAKTVRELAGLVADLQGLEAACIPDAVSLSSEDLSASTRCKQVALSNGESLWVATNLNRPYSERLMGELLARLDGFDLRVLKHGQAIATARP